MIILKLYLLISASSMCDLLIQSMYTYCFPLFSQINLLLRLVGLHLADSFVLHPSLRIAQRFDRAAATSGSNLTAKFADVIVLACVTSFCMLMLCRACTMSKVCRI